MKRHKWHLIITAGLTLIMMASFASCNKQNEGVYAPEFTLQNLNGETVSLSDFRGKPVMLVFWEINCTACKFQIPYIQAIYDNYSNDTIALLSINTGDKASSIQEYITSRGITYPVLLDQKHQVSQSYGIPGVPVTFLIDAEGIIKAYKIGAFRNQEELENGLRDTFPTITFASKTETGSEIGNLAPDFNLPNIDGQNTTLSEFRGKTVLLNFWVSSCAACVDEMPYFQTIFEKEVNEELVVLAINCGESIQTVQSAVDGMELTFPMLFDPGGKACTAYKHGAPTTFLIDGNGIIKAIKDEVFNSPEEIEIMLDSI